MRCSGTIRTLALMLLVFDTGAALGSEPKVEDLEGIALDCDSEAFFDLLEKLGETVNVQYDEFTPVHTVSATFQYEKPPQRKEKCHALLRELIARGAEVNVHTTRFGYSPLYAAARIGRNEVVRILLDAGADVNIVTKEGATPLHIAAFKGHLDTVKLLLEAGADVHSVNCHGDTPRDFAHFAEHEEAVKLLEQAERNTKRKRPKKVKYDFCRGSALRGRTKSERTASDDWKKTQEELVAAIAECDTKKVTKLAEKLGFRFHTTIDGKSFLDMAIVSQEYDKGRSGRKKCVATAKALIKAGEGPDDENTWTGETPIFAAVRAGRTGMAKVFIEAEASLDAHDKEGQTPLHLAALAGDTKMVKLLLKAGADPRTADCRGDSPSVFAKWAGFDETAMFLSKAEEKSKKGASGEPRRRGFCIGASKRGTTRALQEAERLAREEAERKHAETLEDFENQTNDLGKVLKEMSEKGLITKDEPVKQEGSTTPHSAPQPAPEPKDEDATSTADPCAKVSIYTTRKRIKRTPTGSYSVPIVVMINDSDETVKVELDIRGKHHSKQTIYVRRHTHGKEYELNVQGDSVSIHSCTSK